MSFVKPICSLTSEAWRPIVLMGLLGLAAFAQTSPAPPRIAPGELVRRTVQNENQTANAPPAYFMFRGTKTTPKGSTTKIYVETSEATAGMVVAYDGKPLTPAQRQAERARIQRFIKDPEELRKKKKQEREDEERTSRIVRALPYAFLYEYAGEEYGSEGIGHPGEPLVKLRFRPNPGYRAPSRVEEVLTGMQGELLLDTERNRLASIDGTLFKEVAFGWGILGRLDRGGHFVVHQEAVENDCWEISSMTLHFTGKILLVKNLSIDSAEVFTGFKRVPSDLTFAQAVDLLLRDDNDASTSASRK